MIITCANNRETAKNNNGTDSKKKSEGRLIFQVLNLGCCLCYNKSLGFHINNQNIITEVEIFLWYEQNC